MRKTVTLLMVLTLVAACGRQDADRTAADQTTMGMPAAAPAGQAPGTTGATQPGAVTDPQIAAIVVAANNADIESGRLAQERATNPQVREFAQRMVTDHTAVNEQATALVSRLGVTPEENPTSRQLVQAGEQSGERLRGLSGAEFDRAYMAHEVEYHQEVLGALDNMLVPNAQNPELRSLLEQTRPAFEAHLEHAQRVQAALGGR